MPSHNWWKCCNSKPRPGCHEWSWIWFCCDCEHERCEYCPERQQCSHQMCEPRILVWSHVMSGITMATTALWLSEITDLWTMSSSISSVLQKMTTIIPVQIRESFGELDMPHYLVWALFCLSAGIFTFSAVCIGIKRKRVFWHEWSGMILLLGIGAFAQVTPFEESLVILPMSTSIILTITHLWYHSSTKALFLEGIPEFKDCDERDTDYSYK